MQHRKWVGLVRLDPQIDSIKLNKVCLNPCATNSSWFQPYFWKWATHGALWVAHKSFDFLIFKFFSDRRLFTKNTAVLSDATSPKAFLAYFRKWWHHQLDEYEFEQAPGVGEGQGSLVSCCPWDCKELDTTEWLNWTELNWGNDEITPSYLFSQSGSNGTSLFGGQDDLGNCPLKNYSQPKSS